MGQAQATSVARDEIRANINENSQFDSAYVIMNGLASVVACYGLFANSPAVVIGAMIIAMLLGPIAGVSLGLVDRNNALVRKALSTLFGGFLVVYGTAFILGLGWLLGCLATFVRFARTKWQKSSLSLVPGGAGHETNSIPGGGFPSGVAAADHSITIRTTLLMRLQRRACCGRDTPRSTGSRSAL